MTGNDCDRFCILIRFQLADRFPQLLWRHECVSALLDTVEALARRATQGNAPRVAAPEWDRVHVAVATARKGGRNAQSTDPRDPYGESDPISVPGLPMALEPPTSTAELADVLADITELACQWLLRASLSAPSETRIAFFRYVSRISAAATTSVGARGGCYAGLATGLYALSPSSPAGPPAVLAHGMIGRARGAATVLLHRGHVTADAGLPSTLAALSSAGVRVRWAGVGSALPSTGKPAGKAASGATSTAATAAGAPKWGVAGSPAAAALGGFLGTSWAQLPLSKLLLAGSAPGNTALPGGSLTGVLEDDEGASDKDGESGSVVERSVAPRTGRLAGEFAPSIFDAPQVASAEFLGLRAPSGTGLASALYKLDGPGMEHCSSGGAVLALSTRTCLVQVLTRSCGLPLTHWF